MKAIDVKAYLKGNKLHIEIDLSDTPADLDFSFIRQGELINREWVARFKNKPMGMARLEHELEKWGRADLIEVINTAKSKLHKGRRMTVPKVMDLLFPENESRPAQKSDIREYIRAAGITERNYKEKLPQLYQKYPTLHLLCTRITPEDFSKIR